MSRLQKPHLQAAVTYVRFPEPLSQLADGKSGAVGTFLKTCRISWDKGTSLVILGSDLNTKLCEQVSAQGECLCCMGLRSPLLS